MSKKILIWKGYELDAPDSFLFSSENIESLLFAINRGEYNSLPLRRIKLDKTGIKNKSYSVTVECN